MNMINEEFGEQVPFEVTPLSSVFGGEVADFDIRSLPGMCNRDTFLGAVAEHGVLVFRDQHLSAAEFAEFSQFCGELEFHVLDQFRHPEQQEIYVISNIVENGKPLGNPADGFGWHSDQSYLARPTAYTILHGIETPAEGGDTLFADNAGPLDTLDPALRARLEGMEAVHSYIYMRFGNDEYRKSNTEVELTEEQKNRVPDVVHPLIRTHPLTGRKSLYLGGGCIAEIKGLSVEESQDLLKELFAHVLKPENQMAHKWRPGDVVIWDNRTTMHTATEYDRDKYRRLLWRTSVRGEVPF